MYGLPDDFDAGRFVGRIVEAVSFTSNTVHLALDEGVAITLEASYAHGPREHLDGSVTSVPPRESRLMQLVGASVAAAEALGRGTLLLTFTNGQCLACYDDTTAYESYRIRFGTEEVVV